MRRNAVGVTLLEALIAVALIGTVLVTALAFLSSSRKAHDALGTVTSRVQLIELAAEVLRYELALAGYTGAGATPALSGAGIELHPSGRPDLPDALTVRYIEDRWVAEPTERAVRFEVGVDGNDTPNLYRREVGSTRQPAVQEVSNMKLKALFTPDGATRAPGRPWPEQIAGVLIELEFSWGETRSVTIAFGVPQVVGGL